jgi:DNA-binding response OmpR family regulator
MDQHGSRDVLIVDDDDEVRGLLCVALKAAGLACDHASHGLAALEHLRARDYAVVLLDLMMPQLDGVGVLRELQGWHRPELRRPVIVVMTGMSVHESPTLPGDVVQAIVRKPFHVADLTELMVGCVAARRAHTTPRQPSRAQIQL